ncbi:F-box/kelch-repeat protein [Morus notabilis]|uniref:F-box/kelch-repeat protein n=1 Tax=Morus notabilis TaxID=981085 RepID=W9RMW9_9ROSA|nr:putative F-box protein At3g24700 [Morus notabilis]EXB82461.1 F-box/kelch-repeat protein [Morus notabilis]
MATDLPEDILIDIFSRLPPESILQFKSVQKSWYILITALVKDPVFVAKNFHNNKRKGSFLIYKCFEDTNIGSLAICNNGADNEQRLSYGIQDFKPLFPNRYRKFLNYSRVGVSHCDGIICLADYYDGRILLCNPATREFKLLPTDPCFYEAKEYRLANVGFGYDSIDDVYKVVCVCAWPSGEFKAHVYTLGNDYTYWRDIPLKTQIIIGDYHSVRSITTKEVHCNGVCYWLVQDNNAFQQQMYSFDMHDEEFRTIPLPDHIENMGYCNAYKLSLTRWNESAVLFFYPPPHWVRKVSIEMWVLRSWRWTKHQTTVPLRGMEKIEAAFYKSDEILIKEKRGLLSYNVLTRKVRRIYKGDVDRFRACCYYVPSLVSIRRITFDK